MDIRKELPFDLLAIYPSLSIFFRMSLMFPVEYDEDLKSFAAVRIKDKGNIKLVINKERMLTQDPDKQLYILCHEYTHILRGHLQRYPDKADSNIWNIATDSKVNDSLDEYYGTAIKPPVDSTGKTIGIFLRDLINDGMLGKDLNILDKNSLSVEDIYDLLYKKSDTHELKQLISSYGAGDIDEHGSGISKDILGDEVNNKLKSIIKDAVASDYGNITRKFIRNIGKIKANGFPFEQYINSIIYNNQLDFSRPSRRRTIPDVYIPRYRNPKFKIYAAVDCSGSCEEYTEEFLKYISSLPEFEEIVIFDSEIKKVLKPIDPMPNHIEGYGGTDFDPIFTRWAAIEKNSTDDELNFIMLTDGDADPPKCGPSKSTVLILTTNKVIHHPKSNLLYTNIKIGGI